VAKDGTAAYLYFGEPAPSVFKFDGTSVVALPPIPIDIKKESSLHTVVTEWKGQVVLSYDLSNLAAVGDRNKTRNITKVVVFDGKAWSSLSEGIQESPGPDGARSILFTVNDELHIMYSDYSTDGQPKSNSEISFRYRVKKWTGKKWKRVGKESGAVYLVQRAEFLDEDGVITTSIIERAPIGAYRQMVLTWKDGKFSNLGGIVRSLPNLWSYNSLVRPGAVIHLNPASLSQ